MISCDKSEWVAGYALGSLSPDETAEFERHLPTCQSCQADLRAYRSVVDQLALAAPVVQPPAHLRQDILNKIPVSRPVAQPVKATPPVSFLAWLGRLVQAHPLAWGAASLVLAAALVFSATMLVQDYQRQQTQAIPFNFIVMHDTDPQGDYHALLVINDKGQFGTLITDNLAVLPAQNEYQLWLVKDGVRTSGGTFKVNDAGYGWLKMDMTNKPSLYEYTSFGVTVEPKGGSPQPTGQKVLTGSQ